MTQFVKNQKNGHTPPMTMAGMDGIPASGTDKTSSRIANCCPFCK